MRECALSVVVGTSVHVPGRSAGERDNYILIENFDSLRMNQLSSAAFCCTIMMSVMSCTCMINSCFLWLTNYLSCCTIVCPHLTLLRLLLFCVWHKLFCVWHKLITTGGLSKYQMLIPGWAFGYRFFLKRVCARAFYFDGINFSGISSSGLMATHGCCGTAGGKA